MFNRVGKLFLLFILLLIIFLLIINVYKVKRDEIIRIKNKNKNENNNNNNNNKMENIKLKEKCIKLKDLELKYERMVKHNEFLLTMKLHKTHCYKIHVLLYKYDKNDNEIDKTINGDGLFIKNSIIHQQQQQQQQQQPATKTSKLSSQIIYVFIIVLIGSLIKATLDLSKQYKMKSFDEADEIATNSRRCSLQEFNTIKHPRRINKAPPLYRGSSLGAMPTSVTISLLHGNNNNNNNNNNLNTNCPTIIEARRLSNITEINTTPSLNSDHINPNLPGKLLGARPVPLIRRSSVPVSLNQHLLGANRSRRPSIESFSEDDSSPDVKRRVRMIHRH